MFFIFLLFVIDVLCEYDALDTHYQCVFLRVSKGLHPDLLYPNDVHILELKDHARNKFLDQMLRKGGAGGGQHDGNGGCDGHGRVSNDDDKNVPSGETRAMPDGHPITVERVGGMLIWNLTTNGFMMGGSMSEGRGLLTLS